MRVESGQHHKGELAQLYGGAYRRLVARVFALTGDRDRAEELVQDSFVRAVAAGRWPALIGSARHDDPETRVLVRALRAARRQRGPFQLSTDDSKLSASPAARTVLAGLDGLPAHDRDPGALAVLGQLSATEIAGVLGSTPERIETRLRRVRRRLGELDLDVPVGAAAREARIWIEQSAQPPAFDQLAATGRRRRRRRGGVAVVVVAALLVAGFTVPPMIGDHRPGPRVPVSQVTFVDGQHAYALAKPCHGRDCSLRVLRTSDAGAHWSPIAVPHRSLRGAGSGMALGVCCDHRLSVSYARPATAAERARHAAARDGTIHIRAVSDDGGRHWVSSRDHDGGLRTGPPTDTVPIGWTPITDYAKSTPVVVAMNTVDQIERPLRRQPELPTPDVSVPFAAGGRLWVTGGAHRDQLAVSDNRGRTWRSIPAPPLADGQTIAAVFPRPGGSAFLQTRSSDGTKSGPSWRLDDGRRWTRLPDLGLPRDAVASNVLPSGELWLTDQHRRTWRTERSGSTAVPVFGPRRDGRQVRVVLAGVTADGTSYALPPPDAAQDVVFTSRDDGRHWQQREIRLPHGAAS